MARTTLAAVRVILGDHIEIGDVDLFAYLDAANTLVTAELGTSGLSDTHLAQIEKYLAAHLATLADLPPGVVEQTIDRDEEVFSKGEGLKKTHFGETAVLLDSTGTLGKAGVTPVSLMVV
ncbi:MAG: hypothetical protein ACR2P3_00795 [Geminicoccaceae bacterium]